MGERAERKKEGVRALQLSALVGGEEGGKTLESRGGGKHERVRGRHRPSAYICKAGRKSGDLSCSFRKEGGYLQSRIQRQKSHCQDKGKVRRYFQKL